MDYIIIPSWGMIRWLKCWYPADLLIAELGHVDTEVVVSTHPLQPPVTLPTLASVQQPHSAVTAAVADLHLKHFR